jgi:antitoxin YefM
VWFDQLLRLAKGDTIAYALARSRFSSLIDNADHLSERFIVTKNGTPKAVVMGAEEYESWIETLELLSNPKAVKALRQGLKDAKAGKVRSRMCSAKISETNQTDPSGRQRSQGFRSRNLRTH